jgi:hypothetical protein
VTTTYLDEAAAATLIKPTALTSATTETSLFI